MKYDFAAIEKKWQDNWEKTKPYAAVTGESDKPKFYGLIEFPYPSGRDCTSATRARSRRWTS
jgi:leucyl-tRNA synthetase